VVIRAGLAAICSCLAFAPAAANAADILIQDERSQPESISAAPDGTLYVGSASSPAVYRLKKGATKAEKFVDASGEPAGTFFLGQLVDPASGTLWTCQLTPQPGTPPVPRKTAVRGFDLKTGKEKLRWALPGDNTTCNDMAVGPDKALYITDTATAKIYRLAPGAQAAELYLDHRLLAGVDGIAFLNGTLYVNSVVFNKLYRIPVDPAGKPGAPVDIWMDAFVDGPDGMRVANGKLFIAENRGGKVISLTIDGNTAHVTPLKTGLKTPTAVEPAGDSLWYSERAVGTVGSIPLPR
jgi:outer membrane protein assembly factor BamB